LKTERNAPCPCGSGQKYKKCCGAPKGEGRRQANVIRVNQAVAYKGEIGRKREAFCRDYAVFKKGAIAQLETDLRQEVAAKGQAISCARGCTHCCSVYVFADLQECECIVHHLYHHPETLQHFLASYHDWQERISRFERTFRRIEKVQEKILFGQATGEERRIFDADLNFYANQVIPCPFLVKNACSIYEIRPHVCAG
jgi:Fe-S-cluster containining protein